ncbi:MAG TPA: FAD-dependent monooxygenase, partial [Pseudonocardia sp.]|nr:FAD-dependent monooxygenase [Pseudonocardia sp.]
AQGLGRSGVPVEVYERDTAADSRWSGYRIHINPVGARALHACLPPRTWQEFLATSGPGGDFGFLTDRLDELLVVEESIMYPGGAAPQEGHYAADRATLRRLLTTGLDDVLHYGATYVEHKRLDDGRILVRFADGRTAVADVLIGADGASSAVRRQYLPEVRVGDIGVVSVGHKVWLTDRARAALPARLTTGMNVINAGAPVTMFTSVFEPPPAVSPPYLLCAVIARPDLLPPDLLQLDDGALRAAVDVLLARWHPALRAALAETEPVARNAIAFRATGPLPPWQPSPVTVLGDAIHLMPPVGGLGGNTALRDAHLLTRQLTAAHRGELDLSSAIGTYEADMRDYGPAAVRRAVADAERVLTGGPAAALGTRSWFRLCAALPPLRRRSFASEWTTPATPREWELAAA